MTDDLVKKVIEDKFSDRGTLGRLAQGYVPLTQINREDVINPAQDQSRKFKITQNVPKAYIPLNTFGFTQIHISPSGNKTIEDEIKKYQIPNGTELICDTIPDRNGEYTIFVRYKEGQIHK